VNDLREAMAAKEGIAVQHQRLYIGSTELKGSARLEDELPPRHLGEFAIRLTRRHPENMTWLNRVTTKGMSLSAANSSVRKDREVAIAAVQRAGRALQFLPDNLRRDKDLVLIAVRQDGYALRYASSNLHVIQTWFWRP